MAKGDGSIQYKGRTSAGHKWLVQVSWGKHPLTNKYLRTSKIVYGTKADARKVRDQMRKDREDGLVLDGSKITFEGFAESYIETVLRPSGLAHDSIRKRAFMLRYTCKYVGEMKLKEITPQVVETMLAAIKRDRTEEVGHFCNATLNHYFRIFSAVLSKGVDYGFILRNPCSKVKAFAEEKPDRGSLAADEASALMGYVDAREAEAYKRAESIEETRAVGRYRNSPRTRLQYLTKISFFVCIRIGLATGLRIGEVLGLRWDCVDLVGGFVKVRQTCSQKSGIKEPKTPSSVRTVALDKKTVEHLAKLKAVQAESLVRIGLAQSESTHVCCNGVGEPYCYNVFWKQFKRFREEAGFPNLKYHELRHTQASILLASGVDVKTVQERLGHSQASITLNIYAHALPGKDRIAADLIGGLWSADKNPS